MADKIQIRRDTAANWSTQNPVLSQGELGAETDTDKIKIGDATSTWSQLSYLIDTGSYATSQNLQAAVDGLVNSAPGALDTLNELAAALGDDANFATTITDAIALKATTSTLSAVATSGSYSDLSGNPTIPAALTDVGITDGTVGQVLTTNGSGGFTFDDTAATYGDSDVGTYLSGNGFGTSSSIISTITDSAPATLDTLNELAAALGDDADFAGTVTTSLAAKANTSSLSTVATSGAYADLSGKPTLSTVATSGAYADVTGTPTIPSAITDLSITDGTVGQVLTTDGSGGFTFDDTSGGGSFDAVASGTLANGDMVVINATGTVSVAGSATTVTEAGGLGTGISVNSSNNSYTATVYDSNLNKVVVMYSSGTTIRAYVGTVSGKTISFGAASTSTADGSIQEKTFKAVFDTNSNKVVVAYVEYASGARYVRTMVGTVSGTSISFGYPAYVEPDQSFNTRALALAFDSSSNKVIVSYVSLSSAQVRSKVGTVSGTGISFGSVTSASASAGYDDIKSVYDPDNNKVVVIYRQSSTFKSIVGTVSGTGISFGSEVQIVASGAGENPGQCLVYDTNADKVVYIYRNGTTGTAIVGTVSGTSISFGTPVIFESSGASGHYAASFDPSENKVVISYLYYSTPETGRVVVGTVSGTSISFNTPVQFYNQEAKYLSIAFDSNLNRSVISWRDGSNGYGKSIVFKTEDEITVGATNLTSENFVGVSDAAYSDGATATIQTAGAVDDAQSSLTAGQAYFLQESGSLATTADSTRVFAAVALSATELMIGRDMPSSDTVTADGNGDVSVAGEFIATSYNETYVALSGTSPAVDCEAGNVFSLTTSGATTFTFSNPPATGTAYGMSVKLVAGGNHAITWPASVDWASATAPDAPASGETDMLSFITHDGGTTWYGFLAGDALA